MFLLRNQICKSIAFRSLKNHSNFLKNLMFSLKDLCKIRSQWIFHCQTFLDWNKLKFWKSAFCKRLTFVQPIFFYLQTKIMPKNSWKLQNWRTFRIFEEIHKILDLIWGKKYAIWFVKSEKLWFNSEDICFVRLQIKDQVLEKELKSGLILSEFIAKVSFTMKISINFNFKDISFIMRVTIIK